MTVFREAVIPTTQNMIIHNRSVSPCRNSHQKARTRGHRASVSRLATSPPQPQIPSAPMTKPIACTAVLNMDTVIAFLFQSGGTSEISERQYVAGCTVLDYGS